MSDSRLFFIHQLLNAFLYFRIQTLCHYWLIDKKINVKKIPLRVKSVRKNNFSLALAAIFFLEILACSNEQRPGNSGFEQNSVKQAKPDGSAIFRKNCVNCHGNDGKLGLNGAKDLSQTQLSLEERVLVITNGRNLMTSWKGILAPEEIRAVAEFVGTLK